jgi:hypothetical protein
MLTSARALGLAALLIHLAIPAFAEDPEGSVRLWLRPGGSYAGMEQPNDYIRQGNEIFRSRGWATVDEFHVNYEVGAEVDADISGRLIGYAGIGTTFGRTTIRFDRRIEASIKGVPITAGLLYRVQYPKSWEEPLSDLDLFAGGGVVYMSGFEYKVTDEDLGVQREFLEERILSGDGLGLDLRLNAEYYLSPSFTLTAGVSYRFLTAGDLDHEINVLNPNAFNPTGDEDGDGLTNDRDPDYKGGDIREGAGNFQRMYGRPVPDPENPGEFVWSRVEDRFLEPFYKFDPGAYADELAPPELRAIYDPSASFDVGLGGIQARIGLSFYLF